MKRVIWIALLSIILLAVGIPIWLFLSLPPLCGNDIVKDIHSPDGQHRAILFERDCGATTGFSTQLAIVGASAELPDGPGNVMIVDGSPRDSQWAIEWTDAETLTVRTQGHGRIFKNETNVKGIAIVYDQKF